MNFLTFLKYFLEHYRDRAGSVVALASNLTALMSVLLQPFLPDSTATLRKQMNLPEVVDHVLPSFVVVLLPEGHKIENVTIFLSRFWFDSNFH